MKLTRIQRGVIVNNLASLIEKYSIYSVVGMLDDAIELYDDKIDFDSDEAKHIETIRSILADLHEYIDRLTVIKSTNNGFWDKESFSNKRRVALADFQADIAQITIK